MLRSQTNAAKPTQPNQTRSEASTTTCENVGQCCNTAAMDREHVRMVCAVCGRTLDVVVGYGWRHTMMDAANADHPAVPVPAGSIAERPRCDFCSEDNVIAILPVASFQLPDVDGHGSDGDWALCQTCNALVVAGNWELLLQRAVSVFVTLPGPVRQNVEASMRLLHQTIRANVIGPPQPL